MRLDSASFRRALGQFAAGVTVVTTRDAEGRPRGLTVSSFCSVSLHPPLVLVCIDRHADAHPAIAATGIFGVSVLSEAQEEVSRRFAGRGQGRFSGIDLLAGANGAPLLPGALAHLECRVVATHPGGDHSIFVGQVTRLDVHPGQPLLHHASAYRRLRPPEGEPDRSQASARTRDRV